MVKKRAFGLIVILALLLINSSIVFAGFFDFFDAITGWATTQTTTLNLTVGNTAPVIGNVSVVSAVTLIEKSNITVVFYFVAHDVDGVDNLNDNSPNIVVNFTQASTTYIRTNTSAVTTCGLVADINAVSANYSCEVDLWFFDPSGSWSINVSVLDNSNARAENSSAGGQGEPFNVNTLTALQMAPTSLTWGSISLTAKNTTSNNDPIYLNNTGNVNITNVTVTAIDLQGETTRTQYIFAENFSASNATGSSQECNIAGGAGNASKMRNNTAIDVNNTLLPVGNNTINSGNSLGQVGQEELFFCLLEVPPTISSQSYSSSALGAWTITIAA